MQARSKKRWKRILLASAAVIVGATLWYANSLTKRVKIEERAKVKVWSEAIIQRSHLVDYTEKLFVQLEADERKKADRLADAYRIIDNPPRGMDLTFVTDYLWSNSTVPVLIYDDYGRKLYDINLESGLTNFDSLRDEMASRFNPIRFKEVGQTVYYDESLRLKDLKTAMADLISSFVSETILNSASVPVIMTDSLMKNVIHSKGVLVEELENPESLQARLIRMSESNNPIKVYLPGEGARLIFFEDSVILTSMRYYPLIQLILITAFLLTAYLVFSSSRKAEQNRVWVGMAKETAHQLGTPLSSLMAWVGLLKEAKEIDQSMLVEMEKDVQRLHVVTDRFSKIGSQPKLTSGDIGQSVSHTLSYMRPRISKKVEIRLTGIQDNIEIKALFNPSLFSWVLENLLRNAVDAMEGRGEINVNVMNSEKGVTIDISDTGKGISRQDIRSVFSPGFTTKKRGWGLGLSLVKRIIEEYHGGKISVLKSEVGVGTTFRINISA
ncbi:MAG: HAMP domain-containing histidine kinase [Flavobacteriales bacterium]|nr:HAMP domain-containing histidine kinase [Flavobacteriales bacterium]